RKRITSETWNRALKLKFIGYRKLSQGLFCCFPNMYLPLNEKTEKYLKATLQGNNKLILEEFCKQTPKDFEQYEYLQQACSNFYGKSFPEISHDAYLWEKAQGLNDQESDIVSQKSEEDKKPRKSLNSILYGPPGTGKTYKTREIAVAICDRKVPEGREAVNRRYHELYELGRIRFVTFHQSFSYEDFVEGLWPKNINGRIEYEIRDGIFKSIANDARKSLTQKNKNIGRHIESRDDEVNFDRLYSEFINRLTRNPSVSSKTGIDYEVEIEEDRIVVNSLESRPSISKRLIKRLFDQYGSWQIDKFSELSPEDIRKPAGGGNLTVKWSIFKRFLEVRDEVNAAGNEPPPENIGSPVASYIPYVLIIDEINRANISKVFGELITLIEDDKRLGAKEEIKVRLPYSRDDF
ncbi:MAG: hypothetical protein D6732_21625, partial [Methanobacteriota archaeon]